MTSIHPARLVALSDREFKRETNAPADQPPPDRKFRPFRLSLARYDRDWDRKRGAAARLMAVLLRENDEQLTERVCESALSSQTYAGAASWLGQEALYLRKLASRMETASGRLNVVLARCGHRRQPSDAAPAP
ncbi:MAG: hypothetical protein QM696_08620 [Steroidobacteraceae bacterium]